MDTSIVATPTPASRTSRLYPDLVALHKQASASSTSQAARPAFPPTSQQRSFQTNGSQQHLFSGQPASNQQQQQQSQQHSANSSHGLARPAEVLQSLANSQPIRHVAAVVAQPINALQEKVSTSPQSAPNPADADQLRKINAKIAFSNLRFNLAYLIATWWITTSSPYKYLRALSMDPNSNLDTAWTWGVRSLTALFVFNIFYSILALTRPSSSPIVSSSRELGAQSKTRTPAMENVVHAPARSSPKSRGSLPMSSSPIAKPLAGSPLRDQSTNNSSNSAQPISRSTPQRNSTGGSPFRSANTPTTNLRSVLLAQGNSPRSSPQSANNSFDVSLQEQALLGRHSPKQVVTDRSKTASEKAAIERLLNLSMPLANTVQTS